MRDLVVAMTGASGALYAVRLLEVLLVAGRNVHLTFSPSAALVFEKELGLLVRPDDFEPGQLFPSADDLTHEPALARLKSLRSGFKEIPPAGPHVSAGKISYHHYRNFMAGIASGSFLTGGMVICPCSMGTLASIAGGHSENLIQRAADVHLKERRKLVLVPRETPMSLPQLDNLRKCAEAGAIVLPAMPGWYHGVKTLQDLIDFVVARICDQMNVEHALIKRWGD